MSLRAIVGSVAISLSIIFPLKLNALETINNDIQAALVFGNPIKTQQILTLNIDEFPLGTSWTATAHGNSIIIGSGRGMKGEIVISNLDTGKTSSFTVYADSFKEGVAVATCKDIDTYKIVTVPLTLNAHVLKFTDQGRQLSPGVVSSVTNNQASHNNITCADTDGDGTEEIIIGTQEGSELKIQILDLNTEKEISGFTINRGPYEFHLNRIDLGGDGIDEIILGSGGMQKPKVLLLRSDGTLINHFEVFPSSFIGGINVLGTDLNGDGKDELIVGAGKSGGQMRILNGFNQEIMSDGYFPFGKNHKQGIIPLYTDSGLIALNSNLPISNVEIPKSININISKQQMSILSHGIESASFPVSTGTWYYPTPLGKHAIANKFLRAYSRPYSLYMPYWMAITPNGKYGIHELPEWKDGTKEGEDHLGQRRSHGCIRLGVGPAKAIYNWAEMGTPVYITSN